MSKDKNTIASVGIAGAIVGAGLTAAAVVLSDKKNRDTAIKTMGQVKKHADQLIHRTSNEMEKLAEKADKQASDVLNRVDNVKESMNEPATELKDNANAIKM